MSAQLIDMKSLLTTGQRLQLIRFNQASEIQEKKAKLLRKEHVKEHHIK